MGEPKLVDLDRELEEAKRREKAALEAFYFAKARLNMVKEQVYRIEDKIIAIKQGKLNLDHELESWTE